MPKKLRVILSENLVRIMEREPRMTQAQLGKLSGLPQRTVGRIRNGENDATLDNIEALSKGTGLEPWQLLFPDLDPANPPVIRPVTATEKALYKRLNAALELLEAK